MKKNKIFYALFCALLCVVAFAGCSQTSENNDGDNESTKNEVTYNGITNPPGEHKAHTVVPLTTTTRAKVTTVVPVETSVPEEESTTVTTVFETEVTTFTTTTAPQGSDNAESDTSSDASVVSPDELLFSVSNSNSWEQNGSTVYQYEFTIVNNGTSAISGWSVELPVSDGSELLQGWSATYSLSGSSLSITPVDFNTTIESGGSVSFGFQVVSTSPVDPSSAVLNANGVTISPTV